MANKDNSNRLKPNHHAKPYDRPNAQPRSLFRKMASTVRDMLVPSWLTRSTLWKTDDQSQQTTPEGREASESRVRTSHTVSKESLNAPLISLQPRPRLPLKRPKETDETAASIPQENPFAFLCPAPQKAKADEIPTSPNTEYESCPGTSSAEPQVTGVRTQYMVSNGDDRSENSEASASTSGCSSLGPSYQDRPEHHPFAGLPVDEAGLERLRKELRQTRQLNHPTENAGSGRRLERDSDGSTNQSQVSLWSENGESSGVRRLSRPQPAPQGKRPCFTLSAFGTPLVRDSSRETTLLQSPFYRGKTTYGGASAYRRSRLAVPGPYQPSRVPAVDVKVRESQGLADTSDCMSVTAKRIMQALEKMSTPLSDAKKIPVDTNSTDLSRLFSPGSTRTRPWSRQRRTSDSTATAQGPPTSNFDTPSPLRLARNLEIKATSTAEHCQKSETSLVETPALDTGPVSMYNEQTKGGGKLRSHLMQTSRQSSRRLHETEVMTEKLHLPSIPLSIKSLPTFNFIKSGNKRSPAKEKDESRVASWTDLAQNGQGGAQPQFVFCTPIEHLVPDSLLLRSEEGDRNNNTYAFSSPVLITDRSSPNLKLSAVDKSRAVSLNPSGTPEIPSSFSGTKSLDTGDPKYKAGESVASEVNPEITTMMDTARSRTSSPMRVAVPPSEEHDQPTGSVTTLTGFGDKYKPPAGSWECQVCLLRNRVDRICCVACEATKPSSSPAKSAVPVVGLADRLDSPSSNTPCCKCKTTIEGGATECASCKNIGRDNCLQSSPSSTSGKEQPPSNKAGIGFGNNFKPTVGSWECDTCWVRNPPNSLKCVACGTSPASAVTTSSDVKQVFSGFKFGASTTAPSAASFTFGNPITQTPAVTVSGTPSFSFGSRVPAAASKGSSTTFKFGLPPAETRAAPSPVTGGGSGFVFGNSPVVSSVAGSTATSVTFSTTVPISASTFFKFGDSGSKSKDRDCAAQDRPSRHDSSSCEKNVPSDPFLASGTTVTDAMPLPITGRSGATPMSSGFKICEPFGKSSSGQLDGPAISSSSVTPAVTSSATVPPSVSSSSSFSFAKPATGLFPATSGFSLGMVPPTLSTSQQETTSFGAQETKPTSIFGSGVGGNDVKSTETPMTGFCFAKPSPNLSLVAASSTTTVPALAPADSTFKTGTTTSDATATSSASLFKFSSTGGIQPAASPFVFGQPKTETLQPVQGGFTFNFSGSAGVKQEGKSQPLVFGAGTTAPRPCTSAPAFGFPVAQPATASGSVFGAGLAANTFGFGAAAPAPAAPEVPVFGPSAAGGTAAQPEFGRAIASLPVFGQPKSESGMVGFSFNPPVTSATEVFRFQAQQEPAGTAMPKFSFGETPNVLQPTASVFPAAGNPVFSFGATTPAAGIQFSSADNPFSATSAVPGRKMRRAIRRSVRKVNE